MNKRRVVVVEDDPAIRRGVCDALTLSGYESVPAVDGDEGLTKATTPGVDLVLLDLQLPKRDGLDVLVGLREQKPTIPVIILTARGTEDDRVRGLQLGADDYVVKPFSARELLARVEAVLRRSLHASDELQTAKWGRLTIDFTVRKLIRSKQSSEDMSETEAILLHYLLSQRQRVVSREELLSRLWGMNGKDIETRTIDMHIARLRGKLRELSGRTESEAIITVRAQGYMAGPDWIISDSEGTSS